MSDWPLPCLALAVRSGDLKMVQLLLKKKAQVNCQLDAVRHAKLTPLHIACGCLEANVVEITRVLLENGAHVNAEALVGNKEYLTFIDPQVKSVKTNLLFFFSIELNCSFFFRMSKTNMAEHLYTSLVLEMNLLKL